MPRKSFSSFPREGRHQERKIRLELPVEKSTRCLLPSFPTHPNTSYVLTAAPDKLPLPPDKIAWAQPASLLLAHSCARGPPLAVRDLLARFPLARACSSSPRIAVLAPPACLSLARGIPSYILRALLRPVLRAQIPRAPFPAQCTFPGAGLTPRLKVQYYCNIVLLKSVRVVPHEVSTVLRYDGTYLYTKYASGRSAKGRDKHRQVHDFPHMSVRQIILDAPSPLAHVWRGPSRSGRAARERAWNHLRPSTLVRQPVLHRGVEASICLRVGASTSDLALPPLPGARARFRTWLCFSCFPPIGSLLCNCAYTPISLGVLMLRSGPNNRVLDGVPGDHEGLIRQFAVWVDFGVFGLRPWGL